MTASPTSNNDALDTKISVLPRPIPHCLGVPRRSAETATGCRFDFRPVSCFASGADGISFHSNDKRFLNTLPAVASFSLGVRQDFLMKHKSPKSELRESNDGGTSKGQPRLPLRSGDMVLTRDRAQASRPHSISKRSGKNE